MAWPANRMADSPNAATNAEAPFHGGKRNAAPAGCARVRGSKIGTRDSENGTGPPDNFTGRGNARCYCGLGEHVDRARLTVARVGESSGGSSPVVGPHAEHEQKTTTQKDASVLRAPLWEDQKNMIFRPLAQPSPAPTHAQVRASALAAATALRDSSLRPKSTGPERRACRILMRLQAFHWRFPERPSDDS